MNRFKQLRENIGITQKEMALKFGIKTRQYQNLEYGYNIRPYLLKILTDLEKEYLNDKNINN